MKRSAVDAGLDAEPGEAKKGKTANDGGGTASAPQSPASLLSPEQEAESAGGSDRGEGGGVSAVEEKPPQKHGKSASKGTAKKGKEAKVANPSSPAPGSDEEVDGKGRGRGSGAGGSAGGAGGGGGGREKGDGGGHDDEDDDEERMENFELGKFNAVGPGRMQQVLNTFTQEQMSRYECYRRSGFQRANMRRLLGSVAGCPISIPMTIVMSGISKMFVGELVETGRVVMTERNDVGPIRPCHIREAYRRLKVEGKVPSRGRPRLFR